MDSKRVRWVFSSLAVLLAASSVVVSTAAGTGGAVSGYVSLPSSARLVDTRPGAATVDGQFAGIGVRAAGSTLELTVAGRGGVPLDAEVVVLTVTAVDSIAVGFMTVHATGTARPNASNQNFYAGHNTASTVIVPVGDDGEVSVFVSAPTQLIVDVSGFFPAGGASPLPSSARLVDSRPGAPTVDGQFAGIGVRAAGSTLELTVAGRGGVPLDAEVVVLTVTAVDSIAVGFMTVHPTGTERPNASNVNFYAAHNIANTVITPVGDDGKVSVFVSAATHLIVDLSASLPAGTYTPLPTSARLVDTRPGGTTVDGNHASRGGVVAGRSLLLDVAGRAGVPVGASAAVLTVTAVDSYDTGFSTVHPTGTGRPNASNLNYYEHHNTANTVIARIGAGGNVCVFASAASQIIVDVSGYFTGPPPPAGGPECPEPQQLVWSPPVETFGVENFGFGDSAADASRIVMIRTSGRESPPATTNVLVSADAVTWSPVQIDGVRLDSVAAGGPGFVAVGHADGTPLRPTPAVWTSTDGSTWTAAPSIDNGPFPFGEMDAVAVTPTGLVAVGEAWDSSDQARPAVWSSPDGLAWTLLPGDPLGTIGEDLKLRMAAGAGGLVAIGLTLPEHGFGTVLGWWSPDGVAWAPADVGAFPAGRATPADVVAFGSGFVTVGRDSTLHAAMAWRSPDGSTWGDPVPLPSIGAPFVHAVAFDGTTLVAVGDDAIFDFGMGPVGRGSSIWMSADGVDWVQVPPSALDGVAILEAAAADEVVRFGGAWLALGTTWSHTDDSAAGIVWRTG